MAVIIIIIAGVIFVRYFYFKNWKGILKLLSFFFLSMFCISLILFALGVKNNWLFTLSEVYFFPKSYEELF